MLGVRSHHDPITGEYAEELMRTIIDMTVHPRRIEKDDIHFNFDWSEVDAEA